MSYKLKIKTAGRNIINLRYVDNTTLTADSAAAAAAAAVKSLQ